jgi:Carboxypeptidase regulatory-like domain/TonB dependent receptor-like, beta-barrel
VLSPISCPSGVVRTSIGKVLFSLSLLIILGSAAWAQSTYGSLVGVVRDGRGSVIPDAKVTLTNTGTQQAQTVMTGSLGSYQFVNLLPGQYQVAIEKAGFKRKVLDNLQVTVQAALRADATLDIGEVTQTVEVSTQAALLQTEQTSLSQAIEGRTVKEMPLNGRNVLNLVGLVPGVIPQGASTGNPVGNQNGGSTTNPNGWGNYQIGGGQANQSASYYDGAPLNVSYVNSVILVPTQDAVQEFRVATNNVSPEFGRFAGGVINLASKSGTNTLHGNAYEYFRNTILNANDYFNNRAGIARPAFNQNQFGLSFTGPIKRDKTFFMLTWENFSQRVGHPTVTTVPTSAMRSGDFSAAGLPKIYDPLTVCGKYGNAPCATDSSGNPIYTRQQFSCKGVLNVICPDRIDPTAAIMNSLWGLPNQPGTLNNWVGNGAGGGDSTQYNVRVDHALNDVQHLFARYTYWNGSSVPNDLFKNKATSNQEKYSTHNAVLGYTWTINPTTVADIHLSYIRFVFGFYPPNTGVKLSTFGPAYAALQTQVTFSQFPASQVQGMQSFNYVTVRNASNNEVLNESITKIMGRHTIKFGAESRKIEWSYGQTNFSSGQFAFTSAFTAENPQKPTGSGYPMASYLLGYPSTGQASEILIAKQQMWYHGAYFQDIYQVIPKVTVNLGVRWDYPGRFSEAHDSAMVFLPNATDPIGQTVGIPLKGLAAIVNAPQYTDRAIHPAKWDLFAPRVGLAYRWNDKSVIRAGYGISYLPNDVGFNDAPWATAPNTASTTMTTSLDGGITPYDVLSNPFPDGLQQPQVHPTSIENAILGGHVTAPVPDQPAPYAQQWNLAIERQFPGNTVLEVGYAGSKGTHLPFSLSYQMDQIADSYLSLGNQLVQQVANPFYGSVPASAGILAKPKIAYGQLLRPFPQFTSVGNSSPMQGSSTWHALEVKVERRVGGGGTVLGTYTWSKLLSNSDTLTSWLDGGSGSSQDWNNPRGEKSVASYDVPQRATLSYVLDLPFGRGRRFAQNVPAVANALIGDWGLSGTTTLQSGFPMLITAQPTTLSSSFGGGNPRPNVVAGCDKRVSGSAQQRLNMWFNTSCFTQPGPYAYGNEPRADGQVRTDGIANWDVAVAKTVAIREQLRLRFETEFFNIANRMQFAKPSSQLGNPLFGKVTAAQNQPRLIQFALRLSF